MVWFAVALLVALVATNVAWFTYTLKRDIRLLDALSEMATRVQHPTLINPRAAHEPAPEPDYPVEELNEMELAGTIQADPIRRTE